MSDAPPSSRNLERDPHRPRNVLAALFAQATPLDLRLLGRVLLHTTVVGAAAGALACLLYALLEIGEELVLGGIAGFHPLQPGGEQLAAGTANRTVRPWLLVLLPAVGAGLSSLIARRFRVDPEGGDAAITMLHRNGEGARRRVLFLKPIMMALTLSSGGSGGREGPTMHLGATIGALLSRKLGVGERERRILIVSGIAAGISAIFRTPLGAALLAVEIQYRDEFESDALMPAVLASVVGYSVFVGVHGPATLFETASHYPFIIAHLPLYALMTLLLAAVGVAFVRVLRGVQRGGRRLPEWSRAAVGGLGVGAIATVVLLSNREHAAMGILGSGYGAAQAAIRGADWLGTGFEAAGMLLLVCALKLVASSLTIGSGGTAGAFAPSVTIGALFGGAFGHAMQVILGDPSIDPGAFALVGMGTLFGGLAHAPLGALVMVCEMAGSYDLLVPLMLAGGIAFVSLRRQSLYTAQPPDRQHSPAHRPTVAQVLSRVKVRDVIADRPLVRFAPGTPIPTIMRAVAENGQQDVFPVVGEDGALLGIITPDLLRLLAAEREIEPWVVAMDAMQPPVTVVPDDDLVTAAVRMLSHELRELLVVEGQRIVGLIDEAEVNQVYLDLVAAGAPNAAPSTREKPAA